MRSSPPQSALRADSSSIEEEPGEWLRARAKAMRKEMTPHEKAMWRLLHEGELAALYWRRQSVFRGYILDFVSHPARLVVEVDGAQHGEAGQADRDTKRTAMLNEQGYRVLRFWNDEATRNRDGVWETIFAAAKQTGAAARMRRWRAEHMKRVRQANDRLTSSSMEEVVSPRSGETGGGDRAIAESGSPEAHLGRDSDARLSAPHPPTPSPQGGGGES